MDSSKFDCMARLLAAAPSRRSVLRGLTAMALGGLIVGRGDAVEARVGQSCNRNRNCGENEVCGGNGECRCNDKAGIRQCRDGDGRDICVDVRSNNDNCGECGNRCSNRKRCVRGKCRRVEEPEDGSCTIFGDCNQTRCCAGFACLAGNSARRACVSTG